MIAKNTIRSIWIMLFVSLILALFPCVEAQQGNPGICPNYYGPFEPDPSYNESCQNLMPAGTFNLQWAHGPEECWDWQYWGQVEMKANAKYVLIYSPTGEITIDESTDFSLDGYTRICCVNEGPDAIVFCLEPAQAEPSGEGGPGQQGRPEQGGPQGGPGSGPEQGGQ